MIDCGSSSTSLASTWSIAACLIIHGIQQPFGQEEPTTVKLVPVGIARTNCKQEVHAGEVKSAGGRDIQRLI
jgi:hypothetical protein